jgi:hypothetical protein
VGGRDRRVEGGSLTKKPSLPTHIFSRENFVNELHKQALVLELKIFDTQTTFGFRSLNVFLCHKALGAVASLLTCPKEGPTPAINSFDDGFRNGDGRHEVERKGAENGGAEGETLSSIK